MQGSKLLKRQYTDEFKIKAARLVESVRVHKAAHQLGVAVAMLGTWQAVARPVSARSCCERFSSANAPARERTAGRVQPDCAGSLADAKLNVQIL